MSPQILINGRPPEYEGEKLREKIARERAEDEAERLKEVERLKREAEALRLKGSGGGSPDAKDVGKGTIDGSVLPSWCRLDWSTLAFQSRDGGEYVASFPRAVEFLEKMKQPLREYRFPLPREVYGLRQAVRDNDQRIVKTHLDAVADIRRTYGACSGEWLDIAGCLTEGGRALLVVEHPRNGEHCDQNSIDSIMGLQGRVSRFVLKPRKTRNVHPDEITTYEYFENADEVTTYFYEEKEEEFKRKQKNGILPAIILPPELDVWHPASLRDYNIHFNGKYHTTDVQGVRKEKEAVFAFRGVVPRYL